LITIVEPAVQILVSESWQLGVDFNICPLPDVVTVLQYTRRVGEVSLSVVTIERLERALVLCAYCIALDGPVYAPLFEKLERELDALRDTEDTVIRAKHLLERYRERGEMKVIR
jgi:hypothetical protein